jgi:cell division septal protein FtsQ
MFWNKKKNLRTYPGEKKEIKKPASGRLVFSLLFWGFLGVVGYALFFSPLLLIEKIIISGNKKIGSEVIREEAEIFLEGRALKIFSNENLLIFRGQELARRIGDKFKKIEAIQVRKIFPSTILITIEERETLLVWCSGNGCFLIDEGGWPYSEADFNSPEVTENRLLVVHDESGESVVSGESVAEAAYLEFILDSRQKIEEQTGLKLRKEFRTPRSISGDVFAETEEGWKILLNQKNEPGKSASALSMVLGESLSKTDRSKLEYVDLRTENKVYYKIRNEERASLAEKE